MSTPEPWEEPIPVKNECGGYYCNEDIGHIDCEHRRIELVLSLFPEVQWDRWGGTYQRMEVFGWIKRGDGRSDFMLLRLVDCHVESFSTSSAQYSRPFAQRLGWPPEDHHDCKRVEVMWPHVFNTHVTNQCPLCNVEIDSGDEWCGKCRNFNEQKETPEAPI